MELSHGEQTIAKVLGLSVVAYALYVAYNKGKASKTATKTMSADTSAPHVVSSDATISTPTPVVVTPSDDNVAVVADTYYDPLYPPYGYPYYGGFPSVIDLGISNGYGYGGGGRGHRMGGGGGGGHHH